MENVEVPARRRGADGLERLVREEEAPVDGRVLTADGLDEVAVLEAELADGAPLRGVERVGR